MKQKSWHINRRQFVRGGGAALALPFLQGMSWGKASEGKAMPKRMVVSYVAYGVYEPKTKDGSHHDWNWWPCKDAGPLTFNQSAAPFAPLKDSVSYLKGLEHDGEHLLSVGLGVTWSLSDKDTLDLARGDSELVVEGVMPDLLHILPVVDDTVGNGILEVENTSHLLGFITNIFALGFNTTHRSTSWVTNNRWEFDSWCVITSHTSFDNT